VYSLGSALNILRPAFQIQKTQRR